MPDTGIEVDMLSYCAIISTAARMQEWEMALGFLHEVSERLMGYQDDRTDSENDFFETNADGFLDFSDGDPFSEGGNF